MAQAPSNSNASRAVNALNGNNPTVLNENQRLEKRADGSVWLIEKLPSDVPGPDFKSRRVDSKGDLEHTQKGGSVWWMKLLAEQEAAETKAAPAPKTTRTKGKVSDE